MEKSTKKKAASRLKKPLVGKGKSPESAIRKLAKSGALKAIGEDAINESHAMGLSVTVLEDGVIYRVHPDGTRTVKKRLAA